MSATVLMCEGCNGEASPMDVGRWGVVCMSCVKARQRAAMSRKCACGSRRRPVPVSNGVRAWVSCQRCLGAVKA